MPVISGIQPKYRDSQETIEAIYQNKSFKEFLEMGLPGSFDLYVESVYI